MMGTNRLARSRGTKRTGSNVSGDREQDSAAGGAKKRRVFGDVSNRGTAEDERKPTAKKAALALIPSLRRSGRSKEAKKHAADVQNNVQEEEAIVVDPPARGTRSAKADVEDPTEALTRSRKHGNNDDKEQKPAAAKRPTPAAGKSNDPPAKKSTAAAGTKAAANNSTNPPTKRGKRSAPSLHNSQAEGTASKSSAGHTTTDEKEQGRRRTRSLSRKPLPQPKSSPRELCSDFVEESNFSMVRQPFDPAKYTFGVADHDKENQHDTLEVSNYVTDIYQRFYDAEPSSQPDTYLNDQPEINSVMRAILVDWLVEVHMKFKLAPETLYLCVNIIDRYCSAVEVERRKLQLVGVTALLLACKYEEIYPPEVRDCVYITDRAYTRQDVLDMEQDIVKTLQFRLTVPTGYNFLVRYLLLVKASELAVCAANYYMERTLQEYAFLEYRPSLVAAAAVCLSLNNPQVRTQDQTISNPNSGIHAALLDYTGFTRDNILEVSSKIVECIGEDIVTASQRQLVAVKRKYDSRKYNHVSTLMVNPQMQHILG